jgi:hypothetical protein
LDKPLAWLKINRPVKSIVLVCSVVFFGVWLFSDFETFTEWLRNHAPLLTFFGSMIALLSFRNSVKVAQQNSRRAAVELAARECGKFGIEVIPQFQTLEKKLEEAGCKYFQHFLTVHSTDALTPDFGLVTEDDRAVLRVNAVEITKAIHAVESFAIPFSDGVAARDVGFRECGPALIKIFERYFGLFAGGDFNWVFLATRRLYWQWRREKECIESQNAYWHALKSRDPERFFSALRHFLKSWWLLKAEYGTGATWRAISYLLKKEER